MSNLALLTTKDDKQVNASLVEHILPSLATEQVKISIQYSAINYKDALAVTGKGKIQRKFPLVPGIDLAGVVSESNSVEFSVGDPVIVNGCGMGELFDGGFQHNVILDAQHVMPLPQGISAQESMILGTAGFTAALAIHRMEQNGQTPEMGPVVVTGATGGVGSIALSLLKAAGYQTIALTSRKQQYSEFLRSVGADQIMTQEELELGSRPLESVKFGGVIDNVGGSLLSQLIAHTQLWGNVACIGLADSHEYQSTVFPLILRGVSLLGVSSTNCQMPLRKKLWNKLGQEWKVEALQKIMSQEISLDQIPDHAAQLINRQLLGRIVVKL
jgi:acrylyl-CoA reductase (NADPH)